MKHKNINPFSNKKYLLIITLSFVLPCIIIILDKVLDLPYLLFRVKSTPLDWSEVIIDIFFICLALLIIIFLLRKHESVRKKTSESLQKSEERFRAIAEFAIDSIFVKDIDLKYIYVNPAMEKLFGMPLSELIGKTDVELFGEEAEKDISEIDKKVFKGEVTIDKLEKQFSGILHSFHTIKVPFRNHEGKIIGLCGIARDITEIKKAEKELKLYAQQLQEHNEDLDAFSHTVAHDLKNPLGNIMGFAEIIIDNYNTLSKEEINEYLTIIIKDGNNIQQIINSLLLFANIRKDEIKLKKLNIQEIVSECINRLSSLIEKSNAKIKLPEIWLTSYGYLPWVEEVWINYLTNAIKYGGSPPLIELGCDMVKSKDFPYNMVRYWISDNGPGITVENQKKIFKKFERLDQVKTEGHGLGLSIVRRIIEKLNGKVWVESEDGKGSCFYFTLPSTNIVQKR
jgi:PAS domain S-box-containing protein